MITMNFITYLFLVVLAALHKFHFHKGTSINFLTVSKDNKPWEDIKKDNLEVIKDPKSFKFSMYNETDKDFSFKIILKLDPISNSGIDVSSLDFKIDHTVPKLIRKRVTNA